MKLSKTEQKILCLIINSGELVLADFNKEDYKKIATICRKLYKKGIISQHIDIGYSGIAPFKQVSYIPNIFSSIYKGGFKNED